MCTSDQNEKIRQTFGSFEKIYKFSLECPLWAGTDIAPAPINVRFVPKPAVSRCSKQVLFDHFSSEGEKLVGYRKTERLGGREINDEIEFSWLLYWNLSGLRSAQDLID